MCLWLCLAPLWAGTKGTRVSSRLIIQVVAYNSMELLTLSKICPCPLRSPSHKGCKAFLQTSAKLPGMQTHTLTQDRCKAFMQTTARLQRQRHPPPNNWLEIYGGGGVRG